MAKGYMKEFTKGIVKENPVLCLVLGTCPTLAVTTSAANAIGMGVAATAVLICSNAVISQQIMQCCLQNLIKQIVFRQLIIFACKFLPPLNTISYCFRHIKFPTQYGQRFIFGNILSMQTLF